MPRENIAAMLQGTDKRSIGRSDEVARLVLKQQHRFPELIKCLWNDNSILRMRAADAAEKVSGQKPRLLDRYKAELLGLLAEAEQIELRWHLAAMVTRLRLTPRERHRAVAALQHYLDDRSSIVKTFTLQALSDLARNDANLRPQVKQLLKESLRSGTPAMKARARKLLNEHQP